MSIGIKTDALKALREHLRHMSDAELLSFGRAARRRSLEDANVKDAEHEELLLQVEEARAEYCRRNLQKMMREA